MNRFSAIIPMLLATMFATPAVAASGGWLETEGASIRLVTAGGADGSGRLKGALEIALKPGWKTYWLDPGDAGVPPQVDISASRDVESVNLRFPAPQRFDDGYAVWAGYKEYVAIALEFEVGTAPLINADVFLGVCEDICIPVQAKFSFDPGASNDTKDDIEAVEAAFLTLPAPATDNFGVSALYLSGDDTARAEVAIPDPGGGSELFIASSNDWYFGAPALAADGQSFDVPVLGRPKTGEEPAEIQYTLINGELAVSGSVSISPEAVR